MVHTPSIRFDATVIDRLERMTGAVPVFDSPRDVCVPIDTPACTAVAELTGNAFVARGSFDEDTAPLIDVRLTDELQSPIGERDSIVVADLIECQIRP